MAEVLEIPAEIIEEAWIEVGALTPARGAREIRRLLERQEAVFSYVLDATIDLSPEAHELALYMAVVVYRAYEKAAARALPAATYEDVREIHEANEAWVENTAGAHERIIDERILPNVVLPQPAVLQYVGDCLFDPDEDGPELGEEEQGLVFLVMKSFVEILDRCAAKRDSIPPKGKRRGRAGAKDIPLYQLKVTLKGIRPPIWRRFRVRADVTLARLHQILQVVMGWTDSHLHLFRMGQRTYGVPDPEGDWGEKVYDERKVRLSALASAEQARFTYDYDFGDGWEHSVVVEKILPPDPQGSFPVCLAGRRACPPEDCGGPWGYRKVLGTLSDLEDPEREGVLEWLGGEWDAEEFDLELVNALLFEV